VVVISDVHNFTTLLLQSSAHCELSLPFIAPVFISAPQIDMMVAQSVNGGRRPRLDSW